MMSSVNNKVGGHCYGTANGGFMKIEMHVCKDEGKIWSIIFVVVKFIECFAHSPRVLVQTWQPLMVTLYEISFLHPVNHKELLWNEPLKVT